MSFTTKSVRSFGVVAVVFALIAAGSGGHALAQSLTPAPLPSPGESFSPAPTPSPTPAPLSAQPASITIAPGVSQAVKILGATAPITAQISAPIATLTVDQKASFVYVTAVQIGTATIHVSDAAGAGVDIPITVAQPAGIVPATYSLIVTGTPASSRFLSRQIRAALTRAIRPTLQPGSSITFNPLGIPLQPLQPGFETSIDVPVTVAGPPSTAPVYATTTVTVQNLAVVPTVPTTLFYDDDPEYVQVGGVLFRGTIQANAATRLYYYHDNLGLPKDIAVVLTPASSLPTRVQLIDVEGGPDQDVMSVGNSISKSFVLEESHNEGTVVDLIPATPFVVRNTLALLGELVAGSMDVRVLMGGPVTVSVVAVPAGTPLAQYLGGPLAPRDGHERSGAFNLTGFGDTTLAYTVGGTDALYTYGARENAPPNLDPASQGHDWGDYGVIHRVTVAIDNPTGTTQPVYLFEQPFGGATINNFVIDGQVKQMGCARIPQRYEINEYDVPANSSTTSTVVTMTDGGSSYPLQIGLTQTPPQPETPPMDATDGCFPKATPTPSPMPIPTEIPSAVPTEYPTEIPTPAPT